MPVRSKKNKRKAVDEPKKKFEKAIKKKKITCCLCKSFGHNKKGCFRVVSAKMNF